MKMLGHWACFAVAAGLLSAPVFAEDMRSASEKVVACQEIAAPEARLVCFESAAAELSALLAMPAVAEAPSTIAAPSASETELVQQANAAPAVSPSAPAAASEEIVQASAAAPADAPEPRSSLPAWIPRITFGDNREAEKEPDEFATTLTRIQKNRLGRHFFTTAEGHVWRQIQIEDVRAPKTLPADVILSQNIMGGLRIKIVDTDRSYGVLRVE